MNDTSTNESTTIVDPTLSIDDTYQVFVSFSWKGLDNGMEKSGVDSRVLRIPNGAVLATGDDLKELSEAIAKSVFIDTKMKNLEVILMNIIKLPIK